MFWLIAWLLELDKFLELDRLNDSDGFFELDRSSDRLRDSDGFFELDGSSDRLSVSDSDLLEEIPITALYY